MHSAHRHHSSLALHIAGVQIFSHIPDKLHMLLTIRLRQRLSSLLQELIGSNLLFQLGLRLPHRSTLEWCARQTGTGKELFDAQIGVLGGVINTQQRVSGVTFIGPWDGEGVFSGGAGAGSEACELGGDLGGVESGAGVRFAGVVFGLVAGLRGVGGGGCGGRGGVAGGCAGGGGAVEALEGGVVGHGGLAGGG